MNLLSKRGHIKSLAQAMNLKAKELQNAGHEVLKLHIGSPSTGAPQRALDYLNEVSKKDILGYSSALGIDPLRVRISEHYKQNYNLNISPSRIIITVGAIIAIANAISGAASACPIKGININPIIIPTITNKIRVTII